MRHDDEPSAIALANTVDGGGRDTLATVADARRWLREHGGAVAHLDADGLAELHALRAAVQALLGAALEDRVPDRVHLDLVNARAAGDPDPMTLSWTRRRGPHLATTRAATTLATPMQRFARSAIALLTSDDLHRLRRCDGPGCTLLFVATNPRRRWCSPDTCGNRVRVARHFAHHHPDGRDRTLIDR
jgi:predicted RNA-binding Zn ribbon-like protein